MGCEFREWEVFDRFRCPESNRRGHEEEGGDNEDSSDSRIQQSGKHLQFSRGKQHEEAIQFVESLFNATKGDDPLMSTIEKVKNLLML